MPERTVFSRRTFLAVAGLGTAALLTGCDTSLNNPTGTSSPFLSGPYQTGALILGEDAGTQGMPLPVTVGEFSGTAGDLPANVLAAVYYPNLPKNRHNIFVPTPDPLHMARGLFPVLLYAHAARSFAEASAGNLPTNRDFTSVEFMLQHVASYGCVALAPDLSWLPSLAGESEIQQSFDERAVVLASYYQYLISLNDTLFANQLDLSRVILVGHSTGAGGTTEAGRMLSASVHLQSLSYGLIAPEFGGQSGPDLHNLLVLGGTLDIDQDAEPQPAYNAGGMPKTLVTIPGANHFGYTNLCDPGNTCYDLGFMDENGTITSAGQQHTGAAYLAALARLYALGDETARPYLSGEKMVEGLDFYGVTGIQILQAGVKQVQQLP